MKIEQVKRIGVVGVGQMGSGIAQVAAMAGFEVLMYDAMSDMLNRARANVEKSLHKLAEKGKLSDSEVLKVLARLQTTHRIEDFATVDVVLEAITEDEDLKKKIFRQLDEICGKEAVFASNTSTIPIGRLSVAVKRKEQVIGMHFMNPVPLMSLVEVIRGFHTNDETTQLIRDLAKKMEKVVVLSKDFPGFIVNRILMPMINEAIYVLQEGVASAEEIDLAMKLGTNQPMGPLALADLIGLDTCLWIMEVILEGMGDAKYRPCPLLRQYVEAGLLGRKSGRGFYQYAQK